MPGPIRRTRTYIRGSGDDKKTITAKIPVPNRRDPLKGVRPRALRGIIEKEMAQRFGAKDIIVAPEAMTALRGQLTQDISNLVQAAAKIAKTAGLKTIKPEHIAAAAEILGLKDPMIGGLTFSVPEKIERKKRRRSSKSKKNE